MKDVAVVLDLVAALAFALWQAAVRFSRVFSAEMTRRTQKRSEKQAMQDLMSALVSRGAVHCTAADPLPAGVGRGQPGTVAFTSPNGNSGSPGSTTCEVPGGRAEGVPSHSQWTWEDTCRTCESRVCSCFTFVDD